MDVLIGLGVAYVALNFVRVIYVLLTGFLYTPPARTKRRLMRRKPLVTVVIPAWNEEVGIARTVRSVVHNGYPNYEVIIVDDGSTDNTVASARSIAFEYPDQAVRIISQDNGGKASALNSGIKMAAGSLVLTLDADSYLEPGSIADMVNALDDNTYGVAIGEVVVGNIRSAIGKVQHYEYSIGFHSKRAQHLFNSAYIFPGALTMFRTVALRQIGEFSDFSSTEDLDISMRLKMAGVRVAYVETALCITEGATTLKGLLNQRVRWRHGYLQCLMHHRTFVTNMQKGYYLTFIELPLQIFGIVEVLLFPALLAFLIYMITTHATILGIAVAYLMMPVVLLMLGDLRHKHQFTNAWVLMMPIMMIMVQFVEWLALLKSIYRVLRRRKTEWTVWQRSGAGI